MWLKTIAYFSSIVLQNLCVLEEVLVKLENTANEDKSASAWVSRLLFNLSEKERRRLASDLHDAALQDQLLWYRNLEIISVDERIPPDLRKQLHNVSEGLLDVIHQIRETCNELRPPLVKEMGIVNALEKLFSYAQLRTNYIVRFNATGFHDELNDEYVLAFYRIVQELLNNATKHSKATQVIITLVSENGTILLNYQDNGIGMDLGRLQSSYSHMGLAGIQERVFSLNGKIHVSSSVGKGVGVSISIPIKTIENVYEQII